MILMTYDFKNSADNSSVLMSPDEKDFYSMQQALYFSLGFELLGAVLFLLTALFVVADRAKAEEVERREAGKLPTNSADD